jgi:hypothetical protein
VSRRRASWLGALALAAWASGVGADDRCPTPTPLTHFGADTQAAKAYFAVPVPGQGFHLVALPPVEGFAPTLATPPGAPLFAGSAGNGALFAWQRQGERTVQAFVLVGSQWQRLGQALELPPEANLTSLYDGQSAPWLVVHRRSPNPGWLTSSAYRLEQERWVARGELYATAVGSPAVLPERAAEGAILTGTARFAAGAAPSTWTAGLPALAPGKAGFLLPIGAQGVAYFSEDGGISFSADRGATWTGSRWRPWGTEPTEVWKLGSDYDLDVPNGYLGEPLPVAWWDQRPNREPTLWITDLNADGRWTPRDQVAVTVTADTGDEVEITQIARTGAGTWLLLSDCFSPKGSAGVALRTWSEAGLSNPAFVPLQATR